MPFAHRSSRQIHPVRRPGSAVVQAQVNLAGNFVADGDSLTAGGVAAETPWPTLLSAMLPLATVQAFGAIGDTVGVPGGNMLFDGSLEVDPAYNAAKPWNASLLWGGINDLAQGRTPAQLHADLKTWASGRRSAHATQKILLCNISWTTVLGSQTNIDAINALLAGDRGVADAVVDVRTALGTSSSNPTFWNGSGMANDSLHPTTTGQQQVANAVYSTLVSLLS